MTAVDQDHHAGSRDLPARWTGAQLRSMTERTLHDLLLDVQAERVGRDLELPAGRAAAASALTGTAR